MALLNSLKFGSYLSDLRKKLSDIDDTSFTNLAEGDVLTYDSINEVWVNKASSGGLVLEVVSTLPSTGESGKIYLVPNGGSAPNKYDEYVWVNNAFELIGASNEEPLHVYGFTIDQTDSNPETSVAYTDDAVGMTPFQMDLTTGVPNYGSWENAFFMPKACMLKSDGTVDYYLDPDDYSKKEDGTASDISSESYDGNAMMEWPVIYVFRETVNDVITVKIANKEVDSDYKCWSNIKPDGSIGKFYTPIYNGFLDSNNKLRSLSGKAITQGATGTNNMTYAQNNGSGWNIEVIADRFLINDLLVLIGKNLNTQAVFGEGYTTGGTSSNMEPTGTADAKGMFYGLSDNTTPVKVFGMENYWGQQFRWTAGLITDAGIYKVKLTHGTEDGSSVTGYNTDGTGYVNTNITGSTSTGYITKMTANEQGMFPVTLSGSTSTYYSDYFYGSANNARFARVGGASDSGSACGAFCLSLNAGASGTYWYSGAALSYK